MIFLQRERERERERANLLSEIQQLEAIANRTPQQEQELQEKKRRLAELDSLQGTSSNKTIYIFLVIGGILLVGLVIYLLLRKNKSKK